MYVKDYWFSDDLDFTLLLDMEKETLYEIILNTVRLAREKSGIEFSEDIKIEINPNGYVVSTYFKNLVGSGNSIRIGCGTKLIFTHPQHVVPQRCAEIRRVHSVFSF